MQNADLIIKCPYLITMAPGDKELKRDYGLAIKGDKIIDLDSFTAMAERYKGAGIIQPGNSLLMPGMINTHGHLPMIGFCGKMPDGLPFESILFNYMLPLESEFLPRRDFIYLCTLLGCIELAAAGVTTSVEMYYQAADMIKAFSEAGLRGVIGETVMSEFPSPAGLTADEALAYIRQVNRDLPSGDRLVELAVAPHSAYSCNDETLLKSTALAQELEIPLLIHAAESPGEEDRGTKGAPPPPASFYRTRPGVKDYPLVHLSKQGIFKVPRALLAHCIYLHDEEIEYLAGDNSGISYNGVCNTQIGLDIAPVASMRKAGLPVGIGTDGPLTNDRLDLFSQLLPLLCFQRHKQQASELMSCYDVLQMATLEGARAIGLENKIGSIEKGKKADIIALDLNESPRAQLYLDNDSVYSYIVKNCSARQVNFCLVNGREPVLPDKADIMARLAPLLKEIHAWTPGGRKSKQEVER